MKYLGDKCSFMEGLGFACDALGTHIYRYDNLYFSRCAKHLVELTSYHYIHIYISSREEMIVAETMDS